MSATPRATPVVTFPPQKASASDAPLPKQLKVPIVVVAAGGEWEHASGELVIGRDSEANIVLPDPLVSRTHARLVVDPEGRVILEDLHSANGVFVNGRKLSRPSIVLGEGDRILIGTTEVSLFSLRASAQVRLGRQVTATPKVAVPPISAPIEEHVPVYAEQPFKSTHRRTIAVTGRADAINMVGQFAEQLMASGHPLEAARALSEHLQNLLKGASAGLNVPIRILESATRYALRLHVWTKQVAWLEYVLELHLAAHQVPTTLCLDALEAAIGTTLKLDAALVRYFLSIINELPEAPSTDERQRLRRIEQLGD